MHKNKIFARLVLILITLSFGSLACGVSSIANLFATPTPTHTFTPIPTVTPSPTATFTPTSTATPLPTGVSITSLEDGSSLFMDYDNNYQLIISGDWIAIPFEKDDLEAMIETLAKENPALADSAKAFNELDPNVMRLVALNGNPDYFANGAVPNINITALADPLLSAMPLSFISGALEESFQQQGMKVLTQGVNIVENANGVDIEYIDVEQSISGTTINQRLMIFQSNDKLIMITMTVVPKFKDALDQEADAMGASVKFIN